MWTLGKSKFSFVKVRKYRDVWVLYYRMWGLDSEATKDRNSVCVWGGIGGKLYIKLLKCVILNKKFQGSMEHGQNT